MNNSQGILTRGMLAGAWALVTYYAGNVTPLFYLMLLFGATDIIMGMAVAKWYPATPLDGWCSKRIMQGFVRKVACIFLVGVAWGIDFMILEADKTFHLPMQWGPYFGLFALCYLIVAEGISILENAEKMGISIPFMSSALKIFREKLAKGPQGDTNNDSDIGERGEM